MDAHHMDGDISSSSQFEIPSNHPGINDSAYMARRRRFFELAQNSRLRKEDPPVIPYLPEELSLWQSLVPELHAMHARYAASFIWKGAQLLNINLNSIPQLVDLGQSLRRATGFSTIAAEGLLPGKGYFEYWAMGIMPCTQFLRHGSNPQYTPEPDIFHDVIGHVPPLLNEKYAEIIRLFGFASTLIRSEEELVNLVKLYWFTIEFGLLEERDSVSILGAGILSSTVEIKHVVDNPAIWKPYSVEEILSMELDTMHVQSSYFVVPSLEVLKDGVVNTFIRASK